MARRRPPNLNTKYGRKRARQEAQYRYDTGTPEYRADIDRIGCGVWAIILVFCVVVGALVYAIGGPDALKKWLR